MDDKITFSSSLCELMKTLNIKNKSLAEGINIDTSVISRWKNGSRRPPFESNYIELISNYMASSVKTSYQLERLYSFAVSIGTDTSSCHSSLDIITSILLHSYFEAETKENEERDSAADVNIALFELIEGSIHMINAGINLINLMVSCDSDDHVFVCLASGDILFSDDPELKRRWCKSVSNLIAKKKRIIAFSKPENNTAKSLIQYLRNLEYDSNCDWYHPDDFNTGFFTAMNFILVEGVGVLSLIDSSGAGYFDFAYLYTDSKSMELYSNIAKRLLRDK